MARDSPVGSGGRQFAVGIHSGRGHVYCIEGLRFGHASIGITLDLYTHSVPAKQREAAEKVAALVFQGGS